MSSRENDLWSAVVLQALKDATRPTAIAKGRASRSQLSTLDQDAARCWLLHRGSDFITVCDMGGLDAVYVHEKMQDFARRGWPRPVFVEVLQPNDWN